MTTTNHYMILTRGEGKNRSTYISMGSMHGGISGEGVRMLDNFRRS